MNAAAAELPTFADASRFLAAGYMPVPVRPGQSQPLLGGWAEAYAFQPYHATRYAAEGVGIVCASRPRTGGIALGSVSPTWVAAVNIHTHDAKLARDLELIVARRIPGTVPVRSNDADRGTLRVYRTEAPFTSRRTYPYALPSEKSRSLDFRPHRVEILSRASAFVASGPSYTWSTPLYEFPRADLPVITAEDADALMHEFEDFLESRGTQWL